MDDDELDRLMQDGPLAVPPDFTARVMQRINALPLPVPRRPYWRDWLEWIALAGGGAVGAARLAGFVLDMWTTSIAL